MYVNLLDELRRCQVSAARASATREMWLHG
jgi:hypothetical protein